VYLRRDAGRVLPQLRRRPLDPAVTGLALLLLALTLLTAFGGAWVLLTLATALETAGRRLTRRLRTHR